MAAVLSRGTGAAGGSRRRRVYELILVAQRAGDLERRVPRAPVHGEPLTLALERVRERVLVRGVAAVADAVADARRGDSGAVGAFEAF